MSLSFNLLTRIFCITLLHYITKILSVYAMYFYQIKKFPQNDFAGLCQIMNLTPDGYIK